MMYLGDQAVGITTSLPEFADIAKIECGNYTPESDTVITDVNILHSLGEIPDFIIYFSDEIASSNKYEYEYLICGSCFNISLILPGIRHCIYANKNKSQIGTLASPVLPSVYATSTSFTLPYKDTNSYVKANVTYHYVIGKFKEVTSNA